MLFNAPLATAAIVLSCLLSVHTSPVPNSLDIVDLAKRDNTFVERHVILETRQGKGAGGKGAGGKAAGGKAARVCSITLIVHTSIC